MAKFAPIYMTSYDGPEYDALEALQLSAATYVEESPEDTAIGTISGMADADDSTLSLVLETGLPDERGYVALDDDDLVVGPNGGSVEAGTFDIYVRETNPWTEAQFRDTKFTITVTSE